jgi:hypothetical protein
MRVVPLTAAFRGVVAVVCMLGVSASYTQAATLPVAGNSQSRTSHQY